MIHSLDYVSRIRPYVPGKPIKELERELGLTGSIKLASNENPLGPSPKAVAAITQHLNDERDLNRYPDGNGYYLKNALSQKLSKAPPNVPPEQIILGNGSNELLDIAVRTFMGPGDEAVMAAPSFVVYGMAVHSVNGIIRETPLIDHRHDLATMAELISHRTKMVFVANPNNPTGTINRADEFEAFMMHVSPGVLVVVDEAYFEYVHDSAYPDTLAYLMEGRDILILRTFSKAYGLAGLRIGYGIGPQAVLAEMNKIREPFNTNSLAQVAAEAALQDDEHLRASIDANEAGKAFLYRELDALGMPYVPTEANFIYMPLATDAKELADALLRQGVIVRPVGPKAVRVTIGLTNENRRFIDALTLARKGA